MITFLHFGHLPFLPARLSGRRNFWPQLPQLKVIIEFLLSETAGTSPHVIRRLYFDLIAFIAFELCVCVVSDGGGWARILTAVVPVSARLRRLRFAKGLSTNTSSSNIDPILPTCNYDILTGLLQNRDSTVLNSESSILLTSQGWGQSGCSVREQPIAFIALSATSRTPLLRRRRIAAVLLSAVSPNATNAFLPIPSSPHILGLHLNLVEVQR